MLIYGLPFYFANRGLECLEGGLFDVLDTLKLLDQLLLIHWPDAWDLVQFGLSLPLTTELPVEVDGKTVHLILYAL